MTTPPEIVFPNLNITIDHLPRVAFAIFGVPVYFYGLFMVCGIMLGLLLAGHVAKKSGQDPELYYDFIIYGILGGIVGARAYYVAFSWDNYKDNLLQIFALREGGIAMYGSILGGVVVLLVFAKVKKVDIFLLADTMVPGLALGQVIGRWGNFFNREVFGADSDGLFAMRYLAKDVSVIPDVVTVFTADGGEYIQVAPTFLYESAWSLATVFILLFLWKHKKFNGQIAALYFIIYGIGRYIIEGIRTDQLLIANTSMPVSQALSVVLVAGGIIFLVIRGRMRKSD